MTPLESWRARDFAKTPEFDCNLPVTPAVVGQLVRERRALNERYLEMRELLRLAADFVPQYSRLRPAIGRVLG